MKEKIVFLKTDWVRCMAVLQKCNYNNVHIKMNPTTAPTMFTTPNCLFPHSPCMVNLEAPHEVL